MKIQNAFRIGLLGTLGVGLGVLILTSIVSLSTLITYIGAALFIALGLEPLIRMLERHKFPRWAALISVLVVFIAALGGLLWALVPIVVRETTQLVTKIVEWVQDGTALDWLSQLHKQFPTIVNQDSLNNVLNYLRDNVGSIGGGVLQVGIGIAGGVFGFIIVLILTLYFVASLHAMKRATYQLVPASKRARFADLSEQITDAVGKYVMGQVALALVNGILSAIFLTIIGAPSPILLAMIAFLFSLVPLVGTISGSVIIVAVCFFAGPTTVITAAIYYIIYMQVEAYVLSPRIMNRAVSVPGAVVVIAAIGGGSLLGVLGALVAIPVAASTLLIIKQVVIPRQNEL
ncbi:MAG: AI-2E family transporter [Microbacteriaceae bacterium]